MKKGFIRIILAVFAGLAVIGLLILGWHITPKRVLGTSTVTVGNSYPTSSYSFSDNDIINAGDINRITTYTGIRAATDTVSLQGQIYNVSSSLQTRLGTVTTSARATSRFGAQLPRLLAPQPFIRPVQKLVLAQSARAQLYTLSGRSKYRESQLSALLLLRFPAMARR